MEQTRHMRLVAAGLTVGLGVIAFPVTAGTDSWSVAGTPSGGTVFPLAIDPVTPSTLYAVSGPGVFKSTDSGASWTLVLPASNDFSTLVVDPLHPQTVYVAASSASSRGVIFKTTDGGSDWAEADSGIGMIAGLKEIDQVFSVAVDPVHAGVVYASTAQTGVYKSTDGGQHWHESDAGLPDLTGGSSVYQILVDPAAPNVVYANYQVFSGPGMSGMPAQAGLYKSVDAGAHWAATGSKGKNVFYVAMDPSDHAHLIACVANVLKSSADSGAHWSGSHDCPSDSNSISIDPADPQHIFAATRSGGMQSSDGGASFSAIADLPIPTGAFSIDPVTPANVYAATSWGMFKSVDGGATWAQSTQGIHNLVVNHTVHGLDGNLYLATTTGIFKSLDQGANWSQAGGGTFGSLPSSATFVNALVEDPSTPGTFYAGTQGGIYKSLDGGDTWANAHSPSPDIAAVAVDPAAPATLYAGGRTLNKSVDGGASWAHISGSIPLASTGGVQSIAVDPQHDQVVYVATWGAGIYKSTDGGAHWAATNSGMGATDAVVLSVAVDPKDSDVVYASTSLGFFKSTDGGTTWALSQAGLGQQLYNDIQIDPVDPSIIYVSPAWGMGDAYVSIDAGATWTILATGLTTAAAARSTQSTSGKPNLVTHVVRITAVALDPHHHTRLLASGDDGRVYAYDDQHPPASGITADSSDTTGSSSSGGGSFSLLMIFGLLGFATLRRRL